MEWGRILQALLLVALGVPSIAFVAVIAASYVVSCELNPWAGYTCANWFGPVVFMAILGVITIIPFSIIVAIFASTSPKLWLRLHARNERLKK